jgi:hypothetical protein
MRAGGKNKSFPVVDISGGRGSQGNGEGGCIWWICFVSIYENRRMKLFEIVLRREGEGNRENGGGGKSN